MKRFTSILIAFVLAFAAVVTLNPTKAEAATSYHIRNSSNSDEGGLVVIYKDHQTPCNANLEHLIRFPGQEADSLAWDYFRLGDVNYVDANVSITKGGTNTWITTRYYTKSRLCIKAYDENDYLVTITRVY